MTPTLRDYIHLAVLAAAWGAGYPWIKIAVSAIPPATVSFGRAFFGLAVLVVVLVAQRRRLPPFGRIWLTIATFSFFSYVAPHYLINLGTQHIGSALSAILVGTTSIFAALIAFATGQERLSWAKAAGVLLGFSGIVVLVGPDALAGLGDQVWGQLAVTGGAACYGLSFSLAWRLREFSPVVSGTAGLMAAVAMIGPVSLGAEMPWTLEPPWLAALAVVMLGVFSTGFGTILFMGLVARAGATFTSFVNYLVPIVAVSAGTMLLGESLGWNALAAMVLVLASMALANRRG